MEKIFALLLLLYASTTFSQNGTSEKFWIELTDKKESPYSIEKPQEFLSPRAIERRLRQGIAIEETDLPVNPNYLSSLKKIGAKIHHTSKWLNATTVIADSADILDIQKLPFVKKIVYVGEHLDQPNISLASFYERDSILEYEKLESPYGHGQTQIEQLNGDRIHDLGHKGQGILIAILDGGFRYADKIPFFDSLHLQGKIIATKDFVDNDLSVYESSSHGSKVLSVMGANLPGFLVGTAPESNYVCIKTEDVRAEYLVEECNWIAGLEYADSLGVDIANSSLGYTRFSDTIMNYSYQDLNGKVSRASRAANIAFAKGMLIVCSAGNSGLDDWKHIGVPSDAAGVLAVGANDKFRERANFSSLGPSSDGRIKPNVMAMGEQARVASVYSLRVTTSNGTSFSAPIMAGMIASLWSAFPEKTSQEIFQVIEKSGHQYDQPDNEMGYGIPDFMKAYELLKKSH